jgi:hypothetical protein
MAKPAKYVEPEITGKIASKFLSEIMGHYAGIEQARGVFMNRAQREREGMVAIYEGLAARGISQKAAKTNVKIFRALEKIKAWIADLEADDRKMAQQLAKMQGDKRQLQFWDELPTQKKAKRAKTKKEAPAEEDKEWAEAVPAGSA